MEVIVPDIFAIDSASKQLIDFLGEEKIILFDAPMGAGKTTYIKSICKQLGSRDNFSSPTFSIINEYHYANGKIYHFDLYRINNETELLDIGIEEYLESGHYCFVEWHEKIMKFIQSDYILIEIKVKENIRYLHASKIIR